MTELFTSLCWQIWYALAKSEAEEMALEYAEKTGLHVVTFCPGAVFGPLLQSDVLNITTKFLRYIIKGSLLNFASCFLWCHLIYPKEYIT